jgi:glycosyltransferase XagB
VLRRGSAVGVRRHLSGARVDSLPAPGATGSVELDEAVHGLAARHPELSAATRLWGWQKAALAGLALGVGGGALLAPETTLAVLLAVMAVPFLCVVVLRSAALWSLFAPSVPTDEPLPVRIDAELLPLYSVLVPLYREASVVPHLVAALTAIDYPAARLEILLVVESIDIETQGALRAAALPRHMRVLVVPDGDPRTKPRAIQYALQFAHGDYVVVYDAEDMPEPDQLRRALAALMAEPGRLGCLQARLNIYNSRASWLTRQFTIEYTALFDCILPTLERFELPVPLGAVGTPTTSPRTPISA